MPNENTTKGMDVAAHMAAQKGDQTYTVRDLIKALAECNDLDTTVSLSVLNMDPVSVTSVDEGEDEVVITGTV